MCYFIKILRAIKRRLVVKIRSIFKIIKNHHINADLILSHVTHYSATNAGDTVLSTAVRDLFNLNFGRISWKLKNIKSKVDDKYIRDLNSTDAVVIGGGGLFLPDTNQNNISNWQFACSEEQYDEIEKPIILFAVGYNYFYGQKRNKLFESNIKRLIEKSSFIGLRNTGSIKEIQSFLGDEKLMKKVTFQPCATMLARFIYPELPPKKKTNKIAFNLAVDRPELRFGNNADIIFEQIAKAMSCLAQKGYEIYFIAHLFTEIPFKEFLKNYGFDYKFYDVSFWDAKRLMYLYNEMDVVIGMRGHGIMIPFGVNCKIIALGSHVKMKWYLEDINALDWYIDVKSNPNTLCEQIVDKFTEIHELNGVETNKRLIEAQKHLWEITCNNMTAIKKVIEDNSK